MRCYIETTADLDRGSTVSDGIVGHPNAAGIWRLVEERRPDGSIPRESGVPGALDPDDLAGLARRDAVAYVVDPIGGFECADRGWLDMAARALGAGDRIGAQGFVDRYWSGSACEDESASLTEVWMRAALVEREALWFEDRILGDSDAPHP